LEKIVFEIFFSHHSQIKEKINGTVSFFAVIGLLSFSFADPE